jgi:hypothetical protein
MQTVSSIHTLVYQERCYKVRRVSGMPAQGELQLTLTISQIETAVATIEKKLAMIHPT